MFRTAICTGLALTWLCGCTVLPQDHRLLQQLSGRLGHLQQHLDPVVLAGNAGQRLGHAKRTLTGGVDREIDRLPALAHSTKTIGGGIVDEFGSGPRHMVTTATMAVDREVSAMGKLTARDGTIRRLLDPEVAARRMRTGIDQVPHLLGLDRPVFRDSGDRTHDDGSPRKETLVEKLLRRFPL